jgi:phosphomannomutase
MDGDFVHPPEPNPKNLAKFSTFAKKKKVDIGFALDPDGDRLVPVSGVHGVLSEEYSVALAVQHVLANIEKGPVVVNQSTSRMSEDIARKNGCKIFRAAVGEVSVVAMMRKKAAVIGGEGNGGVIYPRLHCGRDGLMGIALILDYMAKTGKTIDELVLDIPRYAIVKDKVTLKDAGVDMKKAFVPLRDMLIKAFKGVPHTVTDGVRFAWADRWLHVRTSNTELIIRFIAEAPSQKESESLITEAKTALKNLILYL